MTDIDAKRAKLDEEILAVQLHLSDLRSQRNVLAPISSLPADVLVHIFRSTNDGPISTSNSYNAFLVSWICRLWRKIATRNQSLWSYIDCKDIQLVQLCLERAPTLQLDLQFLHFYPARSPTEFYHIVLSELERTSSLSLKSGSANQPPYLEDFVSRPAPALRSLSLDGFLLPDGTRMFTGISPPLHSLSLFNCDFLWDAPIFGTRLTSLHITSPKSIMSLGGFLSMLRFIPRLQTLRLWNAFRSSSSLLPPFQQTAVHLPHLTLLAVSNCSTDICCSILLGITFTNTANVTLNLHDEPATSRLHNVLQALEQCTVESPWVIDTISAVHGTYCEVRLLSERHGDWTTTKEAVVCVSISPCTMDAAEILHALLALNRDNLETVILNTSTLDITIRPAIWQQVLGTLPRLTKLKVRYGYANSFVDYLAEEGQVIAITTSCTDPPPLTYDQARENITFKALKALEIFRFSEHRVLATFAAFLSAMTLRKEYNVGITGLAFASCHFHKFNTAALSEVIRHVYVCLESELQPGEDEFIIWGY